MFSHMSLQSKILRATNLVDGRLGSGLQGIIGDELCQEVIGSHCCIVRSSMKVHHHIIIVRNQSLEEFGLDLFIIHILPSILPHSHSKLGESSKDIIGSLIF